MALIALTTRPVELSEPIHFIINPLSFIASSIRPGMFSVTMTSVLIKLTYVACSVSLCHLAVPLFQSVLILPFIVRAIRPMFYSKSVFTIIYPFSIITRSILKYHDSCSLLYSIIPIAFIFLGISWNHSAFPMHFIVFPISIITGPVYEFTFTPSMSFFLIILLTSINTNSLNFDRIALVILLIHKHFIDRIAEARLRDSSRISVVWWLMRPVCLRVWRINRFITVIALNTLASTSHSHFT